MRGKRNFLRPEETHTFRNCGCSGILPKWGQDNKFAKFNGPTDFRCRVSVIITTSQAAAKRNKHKPIPANTSHYAIRKLMDEPNCERCGQPLVWKFGSGKTPHLHHNHKTGEIYGFTHPVCNPQALEKEIERLKNLLQNKSA